MTAIRDAEDYKDLADSMDIEERTDERREALLLVKRQ
jgi:hypothetical protein